MEGTARQEGGAVEWRARAAAGGLTARAGNGEASDVFIRPRERIRGPRVVGCSRLGQPILAACWMPGSDWPLSGHFWASHLSVRATDRASCPGVGPGTAY